MGKTVFIDVRHLNFWWGVYGFCPKTSWEDILIYDESNGQYHELAWTCLCSKVYFEGQIEDLEEEDEEEKRYLEKIEAFLKEEAITYHYYYSDSNRGDIHEVPYETPRNEKNIKPSSIETWYPDDGIGIIEVELSTVDFCKKFLGMDIEEVRFKAPISREEALSSYIEESSRSYKGSKFSEELINLLEDEWNVSRDKVLSILNRSVKG